LKMTHRHLLLKTACTTSEDLPTSLTNRVKTQYNPARLDYAGQAKEEKAYTQGSWECFTWK
jgi:hypothetical protein